MAIKRRGDSFQADFTHKSERYRKAFDTKDEAEIWLVETKQALILGLKVTTSGTTDKRPATLEALKDLTHRRYWAGSKGERTTLINANEVARLLGESTKITAITESDIDDMIFKLEKKGNSDATINRKLAALSKMMTFAVDRGYINRKPKIERKTEGTHRIRWYTQKEEDEIIATAKFMGHTKYADLFMFLLDTGARVGEAIKLRWRDVFIEEQGAYNVQFVGRKGGTNTTVPLTARVVSLLREVQKDSDDLGPFSWLTHGKLSNVWLRVRRHMKMLDDDQFVPHAFRHTFCSRLVQAGVPILAVKELAGHKTMTMTLRYSHLAPKNLTNAIATLEGSRYDPATSTHP